MSVFFFAKASRGGLPEGVKDSQIMIVITWGLQFLVIAEVGE